MNNVIEGYRISPQQKRLWMLDSDAGFAARCMLEIDGPADPRRLEEALRAVVRRHEILRTAFRLQPEMDVPVQTIGTPEPVLEETLDLSTTPKSHRQASIDTAYDALAWFFDLHSEPTLRARLVRLADHEHLLMIAVPALCADATALYNIAAAISAHYKAPADGVCDLDEPMQYADISEWMNAAPTSDENEPGRRFWREQVWVDALAATLPFRKPDGGPAPFSPRSFEFHIERRADRQDDKQDDAAVLLAAWTLVLRRFGLESEYGVAAVFDGRGQDELKRLPGLFARCLPVRISVEPGATFGALARHVAAQIEETATWQDCFEWPAEISGAFFPICFEDRTTAEPGPRLRMIRSEARIDRFHLKLECERTASDVCLRFVWDDAVYDLEHVQRMGRSLATVLTRYEAIDQIAVRDVDVLDEAERAQVVAGFNSTAAVFPRGYTLPQLFEQQVEWSPERIAVLYEGSAISYSELNERANQLARHLRRFGVRPEDAVAVCLERSVEMVVAIFGVLKAGAAYIPVDPDYPADRIRYMLENSGTTVVLTQDHLASQLPPCHARIIPIDAEWNEIARESRKNPEASANAENPAYIIYTSGSTGTPKGAAIPHRAICNHMFWMQAEFPLTIEDRVLQKTPFSFDASVWEFYAPLFAGATLVMARPRGHQDPVYMIETIRRERITILQLVPSLLGALLETPGVEECDSLRSVFCGGEPLTVELRQRFWARSKAGLHNLYGPTEATIDATYWRCAPNEDIVPIGRPIANTEIYVLDGALRPAPAGVPGEIYIGGEGLARGYWHRPELTAEKFLPDPFSQRPGARLYRTGDLGRWLPDGRLDCLGRLDHQVKLRGFRIELGEIEARLAEHSSVRQSVVVAREDTPGDRRLVAYVVAAAGIEVNAEQLRAHLAGRLPDYMVPAAFVALNEMPLTPNGKLDRRALPAPQGGTREAGGYVAPRTATEELLAGIWLELLRLERVGVHDNFFAAGGHSLLATQVVARVRAILGVELPLRALFEAPTVAQLATRVDALRGIDETAQPRLEAVQGAAREQLSWAQQRLWFLEQLESAPGLYHILLPVRLRGRLVVAALHAALRQLVARHEALRTCFVMREGQPAAVVMERWEVALPVRQEREWETVAARLAQEPFDLAEGGLLRAELVQMANEEDEEHVLLLCLHHLVADGWSLGVVARELGELYEAAVAGRMPQLAALAVQYGDYAAWQRQWLAGEVRERQLEYWKGQLAGSVALELPTDLSRPAVATRAGSSCQLRLEKELVERLEGLSRREGVTLFMTLLAGFQVLLSRYSGQADIAVGSPIANRTRAELEGVVGMFVNTLVLRTGLEGDPAFGELLGRVREVCLGAYAHQDLPFEQLVEALEPERALSRHPLFQVMFVMQNNALEVKLGDLEAELLEMRPDKAKFDLALILNPASGGLVASLQYATELYHANTIDRMLRHYSNILEAVAASSSTRISELELLSPEERHQILVGRNCTTENFGQEQCANVLLERQAAEHPEALAILYGQDKITYSELNRRANRLASHLRKRGAGPERTVGISLGSSPRLVVAMLAVLKAGAAFVPLAPDYPQHRLAFMIADSGASLIITEQSVSDRLPPSAADVLNLDEMEVDIAHESDAGPLNQSRPEGAAYVIYTSGSTGAPKGVIVEHRALCNFMPGMSRALRLDGGSRVLQFASASFDASIGEIFPALWAGSAIVIAPRDRLMPDGSLLELLREQEVTTAILSPSVLAVLPDENLPALKTLVSAGESCPGPLAARWARSRLFLNAYGPTENTVCATVFECGERAEQPAIGRPIANVRVYILDDRLQPVPDGVAGELYIGGESLARCYLNRPEMTAQKFVPNPFSDSPSRLYRSGDLARYLGNENIEFLGRTDQQVKIRGFRIEPGEIEAALMECPGVHSAAVVAREDTGGKKMLVAYVAAETPPATDDLRRILAAMLPEYMQPSAYVCMPALPVTPNGKIDRATLPAPDESDRAHNEYVPPRNALEEILADLWAATLGMNRAGIHDNFFEMGGHSLLAAEMVFRIRDLLNVTLPLRTIFECPTIAGLVDSICSDAAVESQVHSIAAILKQVSEMPEADAQSALGELNGSGCTVAPPA